MRVTRLLAVLGLACMGTACHGHPPATAPVPPQAASPTVPAKPPAPPPPPAPAPVPSHTPTPQELFDRKSLSDLNAEHPLSDAYFDTDQTLLRDDARQALKQDAEWLAKWPTTKVLIEGHCDERGTAEYNLGLGERRAKEVVDYLESLGVSPARITSDSLGKEKPFCADDTESCWKQNRRGHFVITSK
jgi:peptidoglycan-associated lipoprotein